VTKFLHIAPLLALLTAACAALLTIGQADPTTTKKPTTIEPEERRPVLIYAMDPMCGWCYSFFPVVQQLRKDLAGRVEFHVMSAGLATGSRVVPIRRHAAHIKHATTAIERMTGAKFGQPFHALLEEGSYLNNSGPPSVALMVIKDLQPQAALDYGHRLQVSFFFDGVSLNDDETYLRLADEFEIGREEFMRRFKSDTYVQKAEQEFRDTRALGADGFPALVLVNNGRTQVVTTGYEAYASVSAKVNELL